MAIRLPLEMIEALDTIRTRDGIPISEQLRRALLLWFAEKKLPATRKK